VETFGFVIRLFVIGLGFVAMYGLWQAHEKRRGMWTVKMFEIWLAQFLFTACVIEGNLELMYRGVFPTVASFAIGLIFLLVIKTTLFTNLPYVRDPSSHKGEPPV
jgi:hypothetical protein